MRVDVIVSHCCFALVVVTSTSCNKTAVEQSPRGSDTARAGASARRPLLADVERADAVVLPAWAPPFLVTIDPDNKVLFAVGPSSWSELSTFDPTSRGKIVNVEEAGPLVLLAYERGWSPQQALDELAKPYDPNKWATSTVGPTNDDEPPPPPDDDPPSPSDANPKPIRIRPGEGEMASRRPGTDLAAEVRAAERDTKSGSLGRLNPPMFPYHLWNGHSGWTIPEYVQRLASVAGKVFDGPVAKQPVVVLAHPRAKARTLVTTIRATEGLIGVIQRDRVGVLRVQFLLERHTAPIPRWTEVRVRSNDLEIEMVPGAPAGVSSPRNQRLDVERLTKIFAEARARDPVDANTPIDVLVADDVDVQRLVHVLVALELAGARTLGLGALPDPNAPELALRGHKVGMLAFQLRVPNSDRVELTVPLETQPGLAACYERARAKKPELRGRVLMRFDVEGQRGARATATGIDDELDGCLVEAIGHFHFDAAAWDRKGIECELLFEPNEP
jgi:hypothetical protein